MSPKSKSTATTNPTKKSPQTTSEPENRSCIYSMAKYAFAEQKEAPSESTESGPQVKELLDLYGLLEVREPEVRKIREWEEYCLKRCADGPALSQRSEKTVTAPKITTRRQVRKMSDVSTKLKAIVAENKEKGEGSHSCFRVVLMHQICLNHMPVWARTMTKYLEEER
jgi:hypothetical protein